MMIWCQILFFFLMLSPFLCVFLDANGNYQQQMLKAYCYYIFIILSIFGERREAPLTTKKTLSSSIILRVFCVLIQPGLTYIFMLVLCIKYFIYITVTVMDLYFYVMLAPSKHRIIPHKTALKSVPLTKLSILIFNIAIL